MTRMTWQQFKAWVDAQLAEQGISEDVTIWYIDISFPEVEEDGSHDLVFSTDDTHGIAVC